MEGIAGKSQLTRKAKYDEEAKLNEEAYLSLQFPTKRALSDINHLAEN